METPEQYTEKSKAELIQLLVDATTLARQWENAHAHLEEKLKNEISDIRTAKNQVERDNRDLERKHDNLKEVLKQSGERHKAKLMSVYYLLGSIRKMGTHHEKHVAVGYLQATVDDLVKQDNLSWDQDLFELPF